MLRKTIFLYAIMLIVLSSQALSSERDSYLVYNTSMGLCNSKNYSEAINLINNSPFFTEKENDILQKLLYNTVLCNCNSVFCRINNYTSGVCHEFVNFCNTSIEILNNDYDNRSRKDCTLGDLYNIVGIYYYNHQDFSTALDYFLSSIKTYEKCKEDNKKALSNVFYNYRTTYSIYYSVFNKSINLCGTGHFKEGTDSIKNSSLLIKGGTLERIWSNRALCFCNLVLCENNVYLLDACNRFVSFCDTSVSLLNAKQNKGLDDYCAMGDIYNNMWVYYYRHNDLNLTEHYFKLSIGNYEKCGRPNGTFTSDFEQIKNLERDQLSINVDYENIREIKFINVRLVEFNGKKIPIAENQSPNRPLGAGYV